MSGKAHMHGGGESAPASAFPRRRTMPRVPRERAARMDAPAREVSVPARALRGRDARARPRRPLGGA
jgi:hypothetical protein